MFIMCENLNIKDLEKAENFAIINPLIDFKIIHNFSLKK